MVAGSQWTQGGEDSEERLRHLIFLSLCFVALLVCPAVGNDDPVFVKDDNLNQLILSLLTYSTVAVACSDEENYGKLRSRMTRLLESNEVEGQLTKQGRVFYENTTVFIEAGVKEYKRQPYITCGEYKVHALRLIEASDNFLEFLDD